MLDNKMLKVQSARDAVPQAEVCVCVCVCVHGALQNRQANYTLSFWRVQTIKYTQSM